jgi:hypothetical protein
MVSLDRLLRGRRFVVRAAVKVVLANSQGYAAGTAHTILSGIAPMVD